MAGILTFLDIQRKDATNHVRFTLSKQYNNSTLVRAAKTTI